ncbi:MAG: hypothetical protein E7378_02860 [Clostridiales bacterium]|nr:hypothetical protein [Clostridiales bacterium]
MSIIDFFTDKNNPKLESYLYGTRHIIMLVCVAVAAVLLSVIFRKKSEKAKKVLFKVLVGILLFFEISSRIVNFAILENWTLAEVAKILLPMHICSVMVWMLIISSFVKNKTFNNFVVTGGILATIAFLLYPAVGINKMYMSFTCLYSTISHCVGFITAILMIVLGRTNFNFKKIGYCYLSFVLMFVWGGVINWVIFPGSDYMYMRNDPLELNLGFPYQILYGIILIFYVLLYFTIATIHKKIKKSKHDKR